MSASDDNLNRSGTVSVDLIFLKDVKMYIVYKTLGTPNIELHPPLPSEKPQFVRAWTLQDVERSTGMLAP